MGSDTPVEKVQRRGFAFLQLRGRGGTDAKEGYANVLGHSLYWKSFETEARTKKSPVICLHGGPGLTLDYMLAFADLARFGYRVVLYDQLGCGRSELPKNKALFTIERAVEDLEGLRKELDLGKIHLLGSSYGGLLAIAYALKYQQHLKSIISVSGIDSVPLAIREMEVMKSRLPEETKVTMDKYASLGDYDNPEFQKAMLVFYKKHFCRLDEWPEELLYSLQHVSRDVALTMNGPTEFDIIGNIRYWNVTRELGKIAVPTLVTCGRYDEVSPKVARSIHRGIKGSKLVQFSKSAHMAMWEERAKYMRTVAKFLDTIK
jgi:proline iminopeptidase